MKRRVIAVDIGNSAAKVALAPADPQNLSAGDLPISDRTGTAVPPPLSVQRFEYRHPAWPHRLVTAVRGSAPGGEDFQWIAASVNRPAMRALREFLKQAFPGDGWRELTHEDIPLETLVRNPERVGVDRLLGAYGATEILACETLISVDAGSAVTVDLVHSRRFMGGAILPGVRLQFSVLSQKTDCLPAVGELSAAFLEVPGRDTESAMRCGVMVGIAGAIERLVKQYAADLDLPPPVVLTGGDAAVLRPLLSLTTTHQDGLVLSTILRIAGGVRIE